MIDDFRSLLWYTLSNRNNGDKYVGEQGIRISDRKGDVDGRVYVNKSIMGVELLTGYKRVVRCLDYAFSIFSYRHHLKNCIFMYTRQHRLFDTYVMRNFFLNKFLPFYFLCIDFLKIWNLQIYCGIWIVSKLFEENTEDYFTQ